MKKLLVFLCAMLLVFATVGVASALVIDLLGDKDGFGVGAPIGDGYHYLDYGAYWADNRSSGDPEFTDYWYTGDKSWTHTYSLTTALDSAELEVYVAGIADSSSWYADVYGESVLLGTIPGIGEGYPHDLTRLLVFDLTGILPLDGSTDVTIDVSYSGDGYIIDYAELRGEPGESVPEPATMLLLGSGLIGLGVLGRKKLFKRG